MISDRALFKGSMYFELVKMSGEILYQDCLRMMNEHALKLLLESPLAYARTMEDIGETDKLILEGKLMGELFQDLEGEGIVIKKSKKSIIFQPELSMKI